MSAIKKNVLDIYTFYWTIESWQHISKLEKAKSIMSERCDKGHKWILSFYPNGRHGYENEKNVFTLMYIYGGPIEVIVEFSLLNHRGTKVLSKKSSKGRVDLRSIVDFPNFFNEISLIDENIAKLLREDKIRILCEIEVVKEFPFKIRKQDYSIYLKSLWEDKTCSDVVFKFGAKEIYSHRKVLVQSAVFYNMLPLSYGLQRYQENKKYRIEIVDAEYNIFKEMLRYIYTGKVNDIESIADKLILAAGNYGIDDLKQECETIILSQNITLDNAVAYFDLSVHCNTSLLKKKVIEFITLNKEAVANLPEFMPLVNKDPDVMFKVIEAMSNSV